MQTHECNKNTFAYIYVLYIGVALMIFVSVPSFGASNYSVVGVTASPSMAHAGDNVNISFRVDAVNWIKPTSVAVTVNGHAATGLRMTSSYPEYVYTCTYTVRAAINDPDGYAKTSITVIGGTYAPYTLTLANVLLIDNTPPVKPLVTDDGASTTSLSLHAAWSSSDSLSGIIAYQYAIGTTAGSADVVKWTTPTPINASSVTAALLTLVAGKTYYISAKAENGVGLWSTVGTSDGILFTNATPLTPVVTDDGAYTKNLTLLHASWSSSSTAAEYRYTIGTSPTDLGYGYLMPWTSAGTQTQVTVNNLHLHSGWTYYFYVKARNATNNWSGVGVSDGIEAGVQLVARDFLAGLGDFAWSPETKWSSDYTGGDFQPLTNNEWITQIVSGQTPAGWWGFDSPASNDTVAVGWDRYSNRFINPGTSIECDLADASSVFGSGQTGKCQYFALKNIPSVPSPNSALAGLCLRYSIPVNNNDPDRFHGNDRLTLTLDLVKITGTENLPAGTWVHYDLTIFTGPNWLQTNYRIPYNATTASLTVDLPSDATWVQPYIYIGTNGNLGSNKPGIYVKGAHITALRGGSQITIESQPLQRRTIKTGIAGYATTLEEPSSIAANCDWAMFWTGPDAPWMAEQLREINPNIKTYLYECSNLQKDQRTSGQDIWHGTTIPFGSASTDWLYSDNADGYRTVPGFPFEYWSQLSSSTFQAAWANASKSMIEQYHMDGLYIDMYGTVGVGYPASAGVLPPASDNFNPNGGRLAWESQSFMHYVVPEVRSVTWAGEQTSRRTYIIQNADQVNIDYPASDPNYPTYDPYDFASLMCKPDWKGSAPYKDNSISNTPDAHFNEQCFYYGGEAGSANVYNSSYWLRCLNDMDSMSNWNTSGQYSTDDSKWLHCQAQGADRADGPARGVDGWINFGLCSYLLGQNSWTTFAVATPLTTYQDPTVYIYPNYDSTMDYPTPAGARYKIGLSSPYFLARDYYGDDGGARGGTVVVNADTAAAHSYTAPSDIVDQANTYYPFGSTIQINPNKGKMFFNPSSYRYESVITTPTQNQIMGTSYTVVGFVKKNRANIAYPSDVQIQIDGGSWIDRPVDSQSGYFYYAWPSITTGTHTISSRVYVSSTDYEPEKPGRVCIGR